MSLLLQRLIDVLKMEDAKTSFQRVDHLYIRYDTKNEVHLLKNRRVAFLVKTNNDNEIETTITLCQIKVNYLKDIIKALKSTSTYFQDFSIEKVEIDYSYDYGKKELEYNKEELIDNIHIKEKNKYSYTNG